MTRPLIAGNWKMHGSRAAATSLARAVSEGASELGDVDLAICPPHPHLVDVAACVAGGRVALGAQNAHDAESGAYTGEVSMPMLAEIGCRFVILGHSERRQHFLESDELVRRKALAALGHALTPIVCVGETEAEREDGLTAAVLERQIRGAIDGPEIGARTIEIAYEPVWAIGTGRTATVEMVAEAHETIRTVLGELLGRDRARETRILYGGSVKPDNAAALLGTRGVDGALVGGASLEAASFLGIGRAAG
jgi:triosephosphate isomerase